MSCPMVSPTGKDFETCMECGEQIAWTTDFGWRHSEEPDPEDAHEPAPPEHEILCNGVHWYEDAYGVEHRVQCGCECSDCSSY